MLQRSVRRPLSSVAVPINSLIKAESAGWGVAAKEEVFGTALEYQFASDDRRATTPSSSCSSSSSSLHRDVAGVVVAIIFV